MITCEVMGVTYVSKKAEEHTCAGCVGFRASPSLGITILCASLPPCYDEEEGPLIFVIGGEQ